MPALSAMMWLVDLRTARRLVLMVVGLLLTTTGLTLVFLGMRAVMDVGGACASGGPYVIAQPCPDAVVALLPLGIVGGLAGTFLYAAASARLPGPHLTTLAWPALFLSLGWNFWEYGLNPPTGEGPVWGWIICAVVFVVMGGVPLFLLFNRDVLRYTFWGDAKPDPALVGPAVGGPTPPVVPRTPAPSPSGGGTLTAELAGLAQLHAQGALTDEEFAAAKRRLLESR
jgi:hypothetical protein